VDGGGGAGIDVYGVGDEKSFSPGVKLVQVKPDRIRKGVKSCKVQSESDA
jgi:hypothetical protein